MANSNATKAKNQAVKAKMALFTRIRGASDDLDGARREEKIATACRRLCESNLRKLLAEARGLK